MRRVGARGPGELGPTPPDPRETPAGAGASGASSQGGATQSPTEQRLLRSARAAISRGLPIDELPRVLIEEEAAEQLGELASEDAVALVVRQFENDPQLRELLDRLIARIRAELGT